MYNWTLIWNPCTVFGRIFTWLFIAVTLLFFFSLMVFDFFNVLFEHFTIFLIELVITHIHYRESTSQLFCLLLLLELFNKFPRTCHWWFYMVIVRNLVPHRLIFFIFNFIQLINPILKCLDISRKHRIFFFLNNICGK